MPVKGELDFRFGRLLLPTLTDEVQEAVGDALQTDESGVAVARRRPRQFTFTIPLYGGAGDPEQYASGMRMRRQMRAMMENSTYRLQGIYFALAFDSELNGWLVGGSGQIKYDQGGVTLAQFSMELDTAYRVGTLRTHRPARRVELYDRRLTTVPHDYRSTIYAGISEELGFREALALTAIPPGAADALGYNRLPVALYARAGLDGVGYFAVGLQHANVTDYEQTEAEQNKGDVVVYDRRGFAPAIKKTVANYVLNPSFEYDTVGNAPGWWTVNAFGTRTLKTFAVQESQAISGKRSLHMVLEKVGSGGGCGPQAPSNTAIPVTPGNTYTLVSRYTINTLPTTSEVYAKLRWYKADGVTQIGAEAGASSRTGLVVLTIVAPPEAAYAYVQTFAYNEGAEAAVIDIAFDAIRFSEGTSANPADGDLGGYEWEGAPGNSFTVLDYLPESLGGTNFCPNGSFAHDTIGQGAAGWSVTGGSGSVEGNPGATMTVVAGGIVGGESLRVISNTEHAHEGPYFQATLVPSAGTTISASVWLRGNAGGEKVILRLGGNGVGGAVTEQAVVLTTAWQQFTVSHIWQPAETALSFSTVSETATAQTWFVDGVMMTEGEPVTVYADGDTTGWLWLEGKAGHAVSTRDPQAAFGWEEVYGPEQPLSNADCVVLQNQLCRVRYVPQTNALAVDKWSTANVWAEVGRATIWDSISTDVYVQHKYAIPRADGAIGAIMEWTPERVVLRISTMRESGVSTARIDLYITLQRGWTAPRFETYCTAPSFPQAGCQIRWTPASTEPMLAVVGFRGTRAGDDALFGWPYATGEVYEQLYVMVVPTAGGQMVTLVSIQNKARWPTYNDNIAYGGGTNRNSIAVAARYAETQVSNNLIYGYASLHLGLTQAVPSPIVFEAETYMNSGSTRTNVEDINASAKHAINETQSNPLRPTVQAALATATTGGTLAAATYYYKVVAFNSFGASAASNERSIVTTGTTSKNTVKWSAVPGATGYRIYRGTSSGGENLFYIVGAVTEFADTGEGEAKFPTLAVTDSFNRVPESPLSNGGKWSTTTGAANDGSVSGEKLNVSSFGTISSGRWNVSEQASPATSLELSTSTPSVERYLAVIACLKATEKSGYWVRATEESTANNYMVAIEKWTNGVKTTLQTFPATSFTTGDTLGITVCGGIIAAWKKVGGTWSQIGYATDFTYTTGYTGWECSGSNPTYDNFTFGEAKGGYFLGAPSSVGEHTQPLTPTVLLTAEQFAGLPLGEYKVVVRARATESGCNMLLEPATSEGSKGNSTFTPSTNYTWFEIGSIQHVNTTEQFWIYTSQETGTGTTGVRIDRVVLVPQKLRTGAGATYDGVTDFWQMHLYDSRAVPELVERS